MNRTRTIDVYESDHRIIRSIQRGGEDTADVIHKLLDPNEEVLEDRLDETAELIDAYRDGVPPKHLSAVDEKQESLESVDREE
jgi:hypothetical protein